MHALRDLQQDMADYAFGLAERVPAAIVGGEIAAEKRLALYRNNTRLGLTQALREVYPVVERLVGEQFFNYLARFFIEAHPPAQAALLHYGEALADFLTDFPPTHGLDYLADVARLEWYWHGAYHAADAALLDARGLAAVPASLYPALRLRFHPSLRLLASPYPVFAIWQANLPDADAATPISLAEGASHVVVHRNGFEVNASEIERGEFRLLSALAAGLTLSQAMDRPSGETTAPPLDLYLPRWLRMGLLTGFFIR
ncbi:DNA-binding domain-containing protein [Methylomonas sp. MED-D]|uniref:Putative DNA-binding domain-containing protein n=1 Tax=Methylomonas koyamae TaxID=702114 RepID=A0A177N2C8_9GAMM|nr:MULTISPECIES: DNA-binding domain-containing protein [Methylomonas]MDT4329124.1 DNA-binding domain-containing protein [Methylomonas sp. MV1]OAI12035.1 hypothetical protein A1355_01040 [Methylomonas koyamae]OHX36674.1 hypothetical protein BJL95_01980 [Methylomonas sp. LWB]